MPDLAQYSDEELIRIAGISPTPRMLPSHTSTLTDLSSYSDYELAKLAGVELPLKPISSPTPNYRQATLDRMAQEQKTFESNLAPFPQVAPGAMTGLGEKAGEQLTGAATKEMFPANLILQQVLTGAGKQVGAMAGGFAEPENVAILTGVGLAPAAIARALTMGFSVQMLGAAAQRSPSFVDAINKGDWKRAAEEATGILGELGLGALMATHAVRGGTGPEPIKLSSPSKETVPVSSELLKPGAVPIRRPTPEDLREIQTVADRMKAQQAADAEARVAEATAREPVLRIEDKRRVVPEPGKPVTVSEAIEDLLKTQGTHRQMINLIEVRDPRVQAALGRDLIDKLTEQINTRPSEGEPFLIKREPTTETAPAIELTDKGYSSVRPNIQEMIRTLPDSDLARIAGTELKEAPREAPAPPQIPTQVPARVETPIDLTKVPDQQLAQIAGVEIRPKPIPATTPQIKRGFKLADMGDILNAADQLGGIRPPTEGDRASGIYDGYEETLGRGEARQLRRASGQTPDEMAQQLASLGFDTPDSNVMWERFREAQAARGQAREQQAIEQQTETFNEQAFAEKRNREALPVNELAIGDKFTIQGEEFTVKNVSPDGEVEVDDGRKFGRQFLIDNQVIFPEKGSLVKQPEEIGFQPEETATKEPWQMTQTEYRQSLGLDPNAKHVAADAAHMVAVADAQALGKTIPPEVLTEYPQLTVEEFNRQASEAYGKEQQNRLNELARQGIKPKATVPTEEVRGPLFGNEERLPEQTTLYSGIPLDAMWDAVKGFAKEDVVPTAEAVVKTVADAGSDIRKIFAAPTRGEAARLTAGIMRENLAEMQRSFDRAEMALKQARKYFRLKPRQESYQFIDSIETGEKQANPKLQPFADQMRKILDERREEVQALGTGKLASFIKNYFPHIWKDPKKAETFLGEWFGKGPLEGSRAFLKKRSIPTTRDGIEAGLVPVSDNPVDLVLLKVREMDRYIMAHKTLEELKENGLAQYVRVGEEPPEGFARIDDRIAKVYGKPTVTIKEAFDPHVMHRLEALADSLGIQRERKPSIGGKRLGYATEGGRVVTRFATPESVLAHEIGHQLEWKYNLFELLKNRDYPERTKELRALADLRFEGMEVAESFKKYVRSKDEKIANAVAALIYAPEKFKATAPETWDFLRDELWHIKELRPIFDIKPSMVVDTRTAEKPLGGILIHGEYYAAEPAARLINNYLSPGLRQKSGLFRAYLGAGNTLNQFQLGLSAFHLGFTSMDAMISKFGLGVMKLALGDKSALKEFALTPTAPVTNFLKGNKVLQEWFSPGSQGQEMGNIVDALLAAGGRAQMDRFYQTHVTQRLLDALTHGNPIGALFRLPFATIEQASKPILEWIVPRQKLGVFFDLAKMELARRPNMSRQELRATMGKVWDSVDNRMGQLVYDNLFWNRTTKDLAMASVRSVGWNLGTFREIIGGGIDTAAALKSLASGKRPDFTTRMAYIVALPAVAGALGAMTQYLMTGKGPQELKDYFFPRTGRLDESGRPERVSLPTYMKDVYHYGEAPVRTLANKIHPLVSTIAQMLENRDYYGTKIRNEDDSLFQQLTQLGQHALKQLEPFGVRGWQKERELGAAPAKAALPFIGITPAPRDINMTPAEKLEAQFTREREPIGARTRAKYEESQLKQEIRRNLQAGKTGALAGAINAGKLSRQEAVDLLKGSRMTPLQRGFRGLTLDQALQVWARASLEEKQKIGPMLIYKVNNFQRTSSPLEIQAMRPKLQAVFAGK